MAEVKERPLPEHVTTPLLTLITARSIDEDYADLAARRAAGGQPPAQRQRRLRWTTAVAVAVFGLLVAVVGAQTSRDSEVEELGRAALLGQIESQSEELEQLQGQVTTLQDGNRRATARNNTLSGQLADLRATVSRLEVVTGFGAVTGPGVRMVVSNAPGVDVNSEIRDEDLATLVDGLWQAGAEAIAINDERINVLGGIRNTNRAIHVNGNPLIEPYVVQAIGDPRTLQARLLQTSQGQEWFALVNGLGFRYSPQNVDNLRLPAAPLRQLRHVIEQNAGPKGQDEEVEP